MAHGCAAGKRRYHGTMRTALDAQAERRLPCGVRTDAVFANLPAYVFPVARRHYAAHFGWSRWFYGLSGAMLS